MQPQTASDIYPAARRCKSELVLVCSADRAVRTCLFACLNFTGCCCCCVRALGFFVVSLPIPIYPLYAHDLSQFLLFFVSF
ncbi:hypothetical protein BDN70DRAFT_500042 [Pholiota conissans]|uniref:Uncharacterized protein n=1 Tax=Pholiota conissans TaxID=109636 RepID=A0A9P5Z6D8_9AGAR|nr:hypothetical protein BDN70DRAFT_500042 [Pholiota conissans]